ncbi:RHS repeat-associated core domain-containing protein [Pseudoxanthomonas mexicana]|uniref:RHS repeat-associated core domain-containing protein n=1 Tax=Pseudoxanthomonas mexicana TaxID=128785 RepID=UPI0028993DBF|nr:RHS repeat-associated core domain-containing protein [Pseudoxanthomonas mexicana]
MIWQVITTSVASYPPTSTAPAQPEKEDGNPDCCGTGNPINVATGQKFQEVVDFSMDGLLEFRRYYGSSSTRADVGLGPRWTYSYSRRIIFDSSTALRLVRDDNKTFQFAKDATSGAWSSDSDVTYAVEEVGSNWVVRTPQRLVETYDASGRLTTVSGPSHHTISIVRDGNGRMVSIVDQGGRTLSLTYTSGGTIDTVLAPNGLVIAYGYESGSGKLVSATYGASGGVTSTIIYLYENTNYPLALTGIVGEDGARYATWAYDHLGRATESYHGASSLMADRVVVTYSNETTAPTVTDFNGTKNWLFVRDHGVWKPMAKYGTDPRDVTRAYDANGFLASVTRKDGGVTTNSHDPSGLLTQMVEAAQDASTQRTTQTDWNVGLRVPTERRVYDASNALTRKSIWTYNARGQALTTTEVDPSTLASRSTAAVYCEHSDVLAGICPVAGLVRSLDGPLAGAGDTTIFAYYAADASSCLASPATCPYRKGDLWKVTSSLGHVTEFLAYDGAGRAISTKDPNGVITDYEYSARGWLISTKLRGPDAASEADDLIATYEYWPTGLVKKVTNPDGIFTFYEYDSARRLKKVSDSVGNYIEYTLDSIGNRIQENTRDAGGQLKRTLSRLFNTLGQLTTQADAQANPTDFTYDARGNVDTVEDALGTVSDNNYDALDRLVRTLQDVGGIEAETKFEYDTNDNLTKVTDPKGLDTTYTYNGFGDLVQLSSPDTGVTTYTYDSAGNRASQTDARGVTTTYQYDALNRLTQVGYPTSSLNVSYTYDVTQPVCQAGETFSVGRLTLMVDGSGSTQYCHDRFGQVVRKVQTTNGVALTLQYAYTKGGQLQAMTYPDGTAVDYVRNAQGQVTEVGVAQPSQAREVLLTQATYHPFGPIAGWVYGNGRVMQRNVDLDYRPTSIQGGPGGLDLTYGYDAVGNLTSLASGSPPPLEYGYDALGRLTESRDGPTQAIIDQYTYDKTGNRTSYTDSLGTKSYAYPSTSHRLISVAGEDRTYDAVGNTLSIGTAREFDYNDAGRMSQVRNGGVVAMEYAYNGRGEQVRKHLGASETQALFDDAGHWLGNYGTSGVALQQAIWMDDVPVGLVAGGSLKHVQPDHLGTPRAVIDPVSNVAVWTWDVKSEGFGSTAPQQDPDGNSIPFVLDMRFPGQRFDSATGMLQNWHRDMDPATGRYSQSDPVGMLGGVSTYNYALANPLSWLDRDGLQAERTPAMPSSPTPGSTPVRPFPAGPAANDALFGPKHSWGSAARTVVGACASPTVLAIVVLSAVPNTLQGCDQPAANDECRGDCPPCDPPVGTIMYRLDGPASDRHYNKYSYPELGAEKGWVPTPHLNLYVQSQSPPSAGCKCWARNLRLAVPPPAQPGWVQMGKSR